MFFVFCFFFGRLLLLEKGSEDVSALSQIFTETCAALTHPLGKSLPFYYNLNSLINPNFIKIFVFSLYPENKSYSSVRTEALSVVDLIVKRTGGMFPLGFGSSVFFRNKHENYVSVSASVFM